MAQRFSLRNLFSFLSSRPRGYYYFSYNKSLGDMEGQRQAVKDISFDNLKDKVLNGDVIFIDVREPNELKEDGKIPNSLNIPLGQIAEAFKLHKSEFRSKYGFEKPSESDDFVISCRSGKRAMKAVDNLAPLGYQNCTVYSGSFQDWVKNGGPVEK